MGLVFIFSLYTPKAQEKERMLNLVRWMGALWGTRTLVLDDPEYSGCRSHSFFFFFFTNPFITWIFPARRRFCRPGVTDYYRLHSYPPLPHPLALGTRLIILLSRVGFSPPFALVLSSKFFCSCSAFSTRKKVIYEYSWSFLTE